MKISASNGTYEIAQVQKNSKKIDRVSRADEKKDTVALSRHAREHQAAVNNIKNLPDFRRELVEKIQSQIESDTYSVSARDVASKMLSEI